MTVRRGKQTIVTGKSKLDAAKSPKQIDLSIDEGPKNFKGKTGQGI